MRDDNYFKEKEPTKRGKRTGFYRGDISCSECGRLS